MPYIVVDNFSGGLDSRRHVLNSKPGTLAELVNAHITRGGEIEKRKAFVQVTDLVTSVPVYGGTFGLEATAEGIYVFGDAPAPVSMPAGFIYQRLQHPEYPLDMYLTKVVYSTVYGGKPFVIAEFDGGPYLGGGGINRVAFYDGVVIKDFHEGRAFASEILSEFLLKFPTYITGKYAATTDYTTNLDLLITGPAGKSFTATASVPPSITATVTSTQAAKEAIPETLSKGSFSITGGSISAAQIYQTGRNLAAASLPGIRSIRVAASSATAADGIDLIGWGGATGLKFDTAAPPYTTGADCGSLYYNIAKAINDNTTSGIGHGYSAVSYRRAQNGGNDTNDLIIYAPPSQGATANGVLLQIEFDANPTGVGNLSEFINTATIATSPYNGTKFIATYGTFSGGTFNRVNSVKVDGIEVLGSPVSWETSHGSTATAISAQINSFTSSTEYVASVTDGSKVVLTGVVGSGKTPNGRIISVETEGNVVVSGITPFSGGVNAVSGVSQITRIRYESELAVLDTGDKLSVTIIDPDNPTVPLIYGASRVAGTKPNFSVTYKSKEYLGSGSTLYFSAVNDATKWDIYDTGSGFIDMSNNFGGREDLTGAGVYQDRLAVFSRRNVQLWAMDVDPARNTQVQVLANTGAIAADSIVSVGSIDLLYLADNGVRSVRSRENTDTAYSSDIGSAIDSIIINWMAGVSEETKASAKAVIEPIDGRYWLAIGNKIFVLSAFQGSNIAAWSVYDPGFTVTEMITREDKVYLRSSDNKVYVYGGTDGTTYDDCEVVVELPYLDANKPATYKEVKGVDLTCDGEWKLELGFDHTNPTARDQVCIATQSTFALGKVPATGYGTHIGPRLVNEAAGYARLATIIVHYDEMHSKHDAG